MTTALRKALHVRCERDENGKLKGVWFDRETQTYRSGWWDLAEDQALLLVGGWLYLHVVNDHQADMGGSIMSYELTRVAARGNENRIVFAFDYAPIARGVAWRGKNLTGKLGGAGEVVDADLPHE